MMKHECFVTRQIKASYPPTSAPRAGATGQLSRSQAGQAMIEYMIVLAFGVIVLLKPFSYNDVANPNATATEAPALQQVARAIRDYHEHYTYAMAIAYIPDCNYSTALDKSATLGDIASLTGGVTVGFDRCVDWMNPQIPSLSVSGSLAFGLASNLGDAIKDIIVDTVKDSIDGFLDPSNLLSGIASFGPGDFF